MTITDTQAAWLARHGLTITTDDKGTINVRPINADVWTCEYYALRQWYGEGPWELYRVYISHALPDMPAPAGRTLSKRKTLREALRELLECMGGEVVAATPESTR